VVARQAEAMTGLRALALAGLCAVTASVAASAGTGSTSAASRSQTGLVYTAPLPEPIDVLRRFDPPTTEFGPGHLGVDLRAVQGATVRTAASGVVDFAGQVAGRGVVVIGHPDGIRTEYEPVRPLVRVGAHLRAGEPIGVVRGHHHGCPGSCLHWGARRGENYLDPLSLLRPLGRVVLLPNR
jgi:murein DD-endopeptidase MepM/ murein hydrolase activator NlpD